MTDREQILSQIEDGIVKFRRDLKAMAEALTYQKWSLQFNILALFCAALQFFIDSNWSLVATAATIACWWISFHYLRLAKRTWPTEKAGKK